MKTSSWARLLQVARNFAGKVHLKVDMEKLVSGVTLQSVIAASEVMDDALTRMKARITELYESGSEVFRLHINVVSFGFKYGIPLDADMVYDVRFLPNPFYVEPLRRKTGENPLVREYIDKWPVTHQFLSRLQSFIDFLIPHYVKEGKSQLVIAVGCTGGLHRSVFVASKVRDSLREQGYQVSLEHRDIKQNVVEE